jgi:hypothetical protein
VHNGPGRRKGRRKLDRWSGSRAEELVGTVERADQGCQEQEIVDSDELTGHNK